MGMGLRLAAFGRRSSANNVKIEIWFIVVGTLIDNECMSLRFPQTFCIVFVCWEILQVFERKV